MINVVAEAKAIARQKMEGTTCFVPLSVVMGLLDEIERLQGLIGIKPADEQVIVMKHKDIKV